MTWIIGYFSFQPLFTSNLWRLLTMNRTKIYPCLVLRNFREITWKYLGHTVSSFWCSRSLVVWKMQLHLRRLPRRGGVSRSLVVWKMQLHLRRLPRQILLPKQIFCRTSKPGPVSKVWKIRNCTFLNIVTRVTYEKCATWIPDVVVVWFYECSSSWSNSYYTPM